MREWNKNLDALDGLGGSLHVLTADDPSVVQTAVVEKDLGPAPLRVVDASVWTELDVVNEKRPELPRPTTWVLDPQGVVIWTRTTAAYSERVAAGRVLRVIEDHRAGRTLEMAPTAPDDLPDYAEAVTVSARRDGKHVLLAVTVTEPFHTYGTRETAALPFEVHDSDGTVRAKVPKGPEITGEFEVRARTSDDAGSVRFQVCSGAICSPPLEESWAVVP